MKKSSTANSSHKSNIFTPFKFQFYLLLILISGLLSCSDNESTTESQSNYQPTPLSEQVTDLFIVEGNLKSDTVWIYEQGGPSETLDEKNLENFPNHENYMKVYVHQVLTYNNKLYDKDLSVAQAEKETDVNTDILHRVIKHFKDLGKRVIVVGHSYGAFVITRYLAQKGSQLADKYIIMAGRIDSPKNLYEGLLNKQYFYLPDYITAVLHPTLQPQTKKDKTELFMIGVIGKPRYSKLLAEVNLNKVTYVFANDDSAVGRMSAMEKSFLSSKGAKLIEIDKGGHGAMFDEPYNKTIYDLIQ